MANTTYPKLRGGIDQCQFQQTRAFLLAIIQDVSNQLRVRAVAFTERKTTTAVGSNTSQ